MGSITAEWRGSVAQNRGISPTFVPATARRGIVMCNNRIPRPNVVTQRAATGLTGVATRYRGVRLNNNNHATLPECFQPSTLHKLRQLGLYTNTNTPDTAHQLHTKVVAA